MLLWRKVLREHLCVCVCGNYDVEVLHCIVFCKNCSYPQANPLILIILEIYTGQLK